MYMHMHQQSPQAMTAPSRPPRSPPRYAEVKASSRGESRNYRFTYDMPRDEVADEQPENHNPVSDSPPKQWFSSRREAEIVQHHLMAQPLPQVPVGLPHNELVKVAKQRHLLMDTYDKKTGLFSHDPYHHRCGLAGCCTCTVPDKLFSNHSCILIFVFSFVGTMH